MFLLQIIKCTDTVFSNGSNVRPKPTKQGISSIAIPEPGSSDSFTPFLVRQFLSVAHLGEEFLYMPND